MDNFYSWFVREIERLDYLTAPSDSDIDRKAVMETLEQQYLESLSEQKNQYG